MKPTKRLRLRQESVTDLTTDELRTMAGAANTPFCLVTDISCVRCPSIPFTNCTILTETDSVTCPTDIC